MSNLIDAGAFKPAFVGEHGLREFLETRREGLQLLVPHLRASRPQELGKLVRTAIMQAADADVAKSIRSLKTMMPKRLKSKVIKKLLVQQLDPLLSTDDRSAGRKIKSLVNGIANTCLGLIAAQVFAECTSLREEIPAH